MRTTNQRRERDVMQNNEETSIPEGVQLPDQVDEPADADYTGAKE